MKERESKLQEKQDNRIEKQTISKGTREYRRNLRKRCLQRCKSEMRTSSET
jgi:hypothetical protein